MTLPVFAINLDRSRSRWAHLQASASAHGVELVRVTGVDGKAVPPHSRKDTSEDGFLQFAGRRMTPGEYGCYQSHLAAIEAVAASGARAGIIVEDDMEFEDGLIARAEALLDAVPDAGVIKLLNHRTTGFREVARSSLGDSIGLCLHGPQGSAACYLVTAAAARQLGVALRPMVLPFDVALERGWATGVKTYTVGKNLVDLGPLEVETEIATHADYKAGKLPGLKRLPTHLFRVRDYLSRLAYAWKG